MKYLIVSENFLNNVIITSLILIMIEIVFFTVVSNSYILKDIMNKADEQQDEHLNKLLSYILPLGWLIMVSLGFSAFYSLYHQMILLVQNIVFFVYVGFVICFLYQFFKNTKNKIKIILKMEGRYNKQNMHDYRSNLKKFEKYLQDIKELLKK